MTRQAANLLSQQQQLIVRDAETSVDACTGVDLNIARRGPLARYQDLVEQQQIIDDGAQHQAIAALERLHRQLIQVPHTQQPSHVHPECQGIYMWGDVGRGKTYLMDLFYQSLECESESESKTEVPKLRLHFHRFMARIHKELISEAASLITSIKSQLMLHVLPVKGFTGVTKI
ncbi:AFG1/ZapE family ATPase [Shewanella pealeana]|uniref:ATPase-like protein n=1 Tax=Shewanella pealeana (strain ATCC 700345 / ANG-SQ1) TaxID=398579 RepID=A8H878_SHEPA|nr:AFG1/ZapE family ATPase [Shewanella pealeana]ABV88765.1 ATPase-like protein [Shewanella pealeana ATCC 700345]